MNVINAGTRYQIYGEDVKTYASLPVGSYEVSFNKLAGFSLVAHPDLMVREEKVYGNHEDKVEKVLRSYRLVDRNFGIILSGQKGIGKSLFARILAQKSIESGLPVILVTSYAPGLAGFISSIEQDAVILFDEFEKTFRKDEENDPQEELLSLFDGVDGGHKLFVVTCNDSWKLNDCLINRPGRFHYHFNISNPTDEEVGQYMRDKLKPEYWGEIGRVVDFARTISITYDLLRAIAFELNQGYSLESALSDLNISRGENTFFDIEFVFSDGEVFRADYTDVDLYRKTPTNIFGRNSSGNEMMFTFTPANIVSDSGRLRIDPECVSFKWYRSEKPPKECALRAVRFRRCDYSAIDRYVV